MESTTSSADFWSDQKLWQDPGNCNLYSLISVNCVLRVRINYFDLMRSLLVSSFPFSNRHLVLFTLMYWTWFCALCFPSLFSRNNFVDVTSRGYWRERHLPRHTSQILRQECKCFSRTGNRIISGYANEVGEAFRSLVKPAVVKFSYVVAFGYVAADSIDKGYKESQVWFWIIYAKHDNLRTIKLRKFRGLKIEKFRKQRDIFQKAHANDTEKTKKVVIAAVDTVLWQTFASVLIPGFTINRFCFFTNKLLEKWVCMFISIRALSLSPGRQDCRPACANGPSLAWVLQPYHSLSTQSTLL